MSCRHRAVIVATAWFAVRTVSAQAPPNQACPGQPVTYAALQHVFDGGTMPTQAEMTGTWIAIGSFAEPDYSGGPRFVAFSCDGIRHDAKFATAIFASAYTLDVHAFPTLDESKLAEPTDTNSIAFEANEGGGYQCRLTDRRTLACLHVQNPWAMELRKMTVDRADVYSCTQRSSC